MTGVLTIWPKVLALILWPISSPMPTRATPSAATACTSQNPFIHLSTCVSLLIFVTFGVSDFLLSVFAVLVFFCDPITLDFLSVFLSVFLSSTFLVFLSSSFVVVWVSSFAQQVFFGSGWNYQLKLLSRVLNDNLATVLSSKVDLPLVQDVRIARYICGGTPGQLVHH